MIRLFRNFTPLTERNASWSCVVRRRALLPRSQAAKAFTLDGHAFTLRAAIEHGPNRSASGAWAHRGRWACASDACAAAEVRRALYIGDELFTVSDGEVRATSLAHWGEAWRAPLHVRQPLAVEGTCSLDCFRRARG